MSKRQVTILDYGSSNLCNVVRAFEYNDISVSIANSTRDVKKANHLVLPGVGAFSDCVDTLCRLELIDGIREHARSGKPLLGICVGMQILFDSSEEFGQSHGLSILEGRVSPIPSKTIAGERLKIPHIGWNVLNPPRQSPQHQSSLQQTPLYHSARQPHLPCQPIDSALLLNIPRAITQYFLHSYRAIPSNPALVKAVAIYGGHEVSAIVQQENVVGTQFHPEKSGEMGLAIINNFVSAY